MGVAAQGPQVVYGPFGSTMHSIPLQRNLRGGSGVGAGVGVGQAPHQVEIVDPQSFWQAENPPHCDGLQGHEVIFGLHSKVLQGAHFPASVKQ